jgi:hypothetical protein
MSTPNCAEGCSKIYPSTGPKAPVSDQSKVSGDVDQNQRSKGIVKKSEYRVDTRGLDQSQEGEALNSGGQQLLAQAFRPVATQLRQRSEPAGEQKQKCGNRPLDLAALSD